MTKLKNCPFCGSKANILASDRSLMWEGGCSSLDRNCIGVDTVYADTEEEAIKQWNTRHDDWQPIETAPEDREVLLYENGHIYQANYTELANLRTTREFVAGVYTSYAKPNPTHWKPLPQPPQESK